MEFFELCLIHSHFKKVTLVVYVYEVSRANTYFFFPFFSTQRHFFSVFCSTKRWSWHVYCKKLLRIVGWIRVPRVRNLSFHKCRFYLKLICEWAVMGQIPPHAHFKLRSCIALLLFNVVSDIFSCMKNYKKLPFIAYFGQIRLNFNWADSPYHGF